jgi:thymidylate synthase (FAD)
VIASNHNDEQLGWNEKSFRYVAIADNNEFYLPQTFRKQSKNNKQATVGSLEAELNQKAIAIYQQQCENSYRAYGSLLELGVGREQARGVLIPAVYTSWVWTVSLQALLNFIGLRLGAGAQSEIGAYAEAIVELIEPIVPVSISAWTTHKGKEA